MSYWRKCLSTGDYQYIATGEPAPEDIVVPWWEVELARKDKRIAELEKQSFTKDELRAFWAWSFSYDYEFGTTEEDAKLRDRVEKMWRG